MPVTTLETAENLKKFIRNIKALTELNEGLLEVGGLEQAANEARSAVEAARAELAQVKSKIVAAEDELLAAQKARDAAIALAKSDAANILQAANDEADRLMSRVRSDTDARIAAAAVEIAGAERRADDLRAVSASLMTETNAARSELAKIRAEIQALKDRFAG